MKKIKVFVAYHKPPVFFQNDNYIPIHVWKSKSNLDLWIVGDDTWDNISDKNYDYAELLLNIGCGKITIYLMWIM